MFPMYCVRMFPQMVHTALKGYSRLCLQVATFVGVPTPAAIAPTAVETVMHMSKALPYPTRPNYHNDPDRQNYEL